MCVSVGVATEVDFKLQLRTSPTALPASAHPPPLLPLPQLLFVEKFSAFVLGSKKCICILYLGLVFLWR